MAVRGPAAAQPAFPGAARLAGHFSPDLVTDRAFCPAAEEGQPQKPGFGSYGLCKFIQAPLL